MKLKIVVLYVCNSPNKYGVWKDDGTTVFGRKPLAIFDSREEAEAFVSSKGK